MSTDAAVAIRAQQRAQAALPVNDLDLTLSINEQQPAMVLYRWGRDWWSFFHSGKEYFFPPDLGGAMTFHPKTHAPVRGDGRCHIKSEFGQRRDRQTGELLGYDALEGRASSDIVRFAVKNHAIAGVVFLKGDPVMDKARMELSKEKVLAAKLEWAEGERTARNQFVATWLKTNPGMDPGACPRAKASQREAQDYLDAIGEEMADTRGRYQCPKGCSDWDTFAPYARHMKKNHNLVVEDEFAEPEPPAKPKATDKGAGDKS